MKFTRVKTNIVPALKQLHLFKNWSEGKAGAALSVH